MKKKKQKVGRCKLPSFFVACKIENDSTSTKSLTKSSSLNRSAMDFFVLKHESFPLIKSIFLPKTSHVYSLFDFIYQHCPCHYHQYQGSKILELTP
jgi:hypothetical protein